MFLDLFSRGKMNGTIHTCNGQEFSAIAITKSLHEGDFIFSNHRCHGHYLAHTSDLEGLIAELMGKETGTCGGIGSSQHLCNKNFYSNGIQGGIVPVAAGMALANKKKQNGKIGVVFIGDGTLGQGIVYEAFNLISLLKIPLLIVCENNGYAQSSAQKDYIAGDIIQRAGAFGIKTFHSDIWNLEYLFRQAEESVNYVRNTCKAAFHLVDTYRLNAHSKSDDNRLQIEIDEYAKKDPLNLFSVDQQNLYRDMCVSIDTQIEQVVKKTDKEKELNLESYITNIKEHENDAFVRLENMNERLIDRINCFFDEAMGRDKKLLFIGEDVLASYGGTFKAAKNLSEKYPDNVISTPISEQAITGLANGLALGGYRPYLEIMFGDFITLCMDQIINHASKFHHMYNRKVNCPVVIRTPMGGGRGYGPTHSQTLDKFIVGIDNVTVIAVNSFIDPKVLYEKIYETENHPVVVIENKIDYGRIVGAKSQDNYIVERNSVGYPIVKCRPSSGDPTLTIVSYGGIASDVFDILIDIFVETKMIPELIILSVICPLDIQQILKSVRKTRKLIIVEEGSVPFGVGAEILSLVVESVGRDELEIIYRIGALSVPIPSARSLERKVLPNRAILEKIIQRVNS